MRTDGSKGFVSVNQYQRLHKMKPLEDVRLDTGSVQFPVLKITDGASFILPFNIPLGNVKLRYATAQLLCRTGDTWFFTEIEGNSPEYCLDGEIYRPEQLPDVHRVKDSCIVTLPKEQALYLRKLHSSVFLGDQCDLYWMDEQIHAVQPGSFSYMEWNRSISNRMIINGFLGFLIGRFDQRQRIFDRCPSNSLCRMEKSLQNAINPVSTFGMVFVQSDRSGFLYQEPAGILCLVL